MRLLFITKNLVKMPKGSYKPTLFDDSVNITKESHLLEMAKMIFVLFLAILLLFGISLWFSKFLVRMIPVESEMEFFSGISSTYESHETRLDDDSSKRAERILAKIIKDDDAFKNLKIFTIKDKNINAYATPGGVIIVTTELMNAVENDNELAFVIGHEIGHFKNRHHLESMGRGVVFNLLVSIIFGYNFGVEGITSSLSKAVNQEYSKDQEIEADNYGLKVLENFGGDKDSALNFFKKISLDSRFGKFVEVFNNTHPTSSARIKNIQD